MNLLSDRINEVVKDWEDQHGKLFNGADLARKCKFSRATFNDWKTGRTKTIKSRHLFCVAQYFGVSPMWLDTGQGIKNLEWDISPYGVDSAILAKAIRRVDEVLDKLPKKPPESECAVLYALFYEFMLTDPNISDEEIMRLIRARMV